MSGKSAKLGPDGYDHLFDCRQADNNLTIGAPGPETLVRSAEIFRQCCDHRFQEQQTGGGNGAMFQYGPRAGFRPFREQLAKFLTKHYEDEVKEEHLVLTPGASIGLWMAGMKFLPPGQGVVFMECPSYFIASQMVAKDLGHRVVTVPMAEEGTGVDLDVFERKLEAEYNKRQVPTPGKEEGKFWAMFYTIPTFHNPTGVCLTPEKSRRLIKMARKYDMIILCDDVYNLLHYGKDSKSPKRLFAYDDPSDADYKGHVISNGSFSKILGPGYRVGWMELATPLREIVKNSGGINSAGSLNNVAAGIIASAMELGLQSDHLEHLKEEYGARIDAVFDILDKQMPSGFSSRKPGGGYFIWISGPDSFNAGEFDGWCLENHAVQILPGFKCGRTEEINCENSIRLSFAFYGKEELTKCATKLCKALNEFMAMKAK